MAARYAIFEQPKLAIANNVKQFISSDGDRRPDEKSFRAVGDLGPWLTGQTRSSARQLPDHVAVLFRADAEERRKGDVHRSRIPERGCEEALPPPGKLETENGQCRVEAWVVVGNRTDGRSGDRFLPCSLEHGPVLIVVAEP